MQPRSYQYDAVAALHGFLASNPPSLGADGRPLVRHPICAMPTGTGKSVVIAGFITSTVQARPATRIIKLTHVKELIEQNAEKLLAVWPYAPLGIVSAGLKKKELNHQIIFAGIGSIHKAAHVVGHVDIVIIDECHLLSPTGTSMYRRFLDDLRKINPWLVVIGMTATPYRMGIGALTNNGIFTDTAYDLTTLAAFNWLVHEGYLAPLIVRNSGIRLDVGNVGVQNGEYKLNELQDAVDHYGTNLAIVDDMIAHSQGRQAAIVFCAGVEHAKHVSDCFSMRGVNMPAVHAEMSDDQRSSIIGQFKRGEIWGVTNNNILTTGFDNPRIDLVGMARPTKSTGLWVQMLGRATRPSPETGKLNALVLDYAGNTLELGPINDPVLPKMKGKGNGKAPVWCCPMCGVYNHAKAPACIECGYEHDMTANLSTTAGATEVMVAETPVIEMFEVSRVLYALHRKEGRADMIKVSYLCGFKEFSEYIMLEAPSHIAKWSQDWWRRRFTTEPPATTAEALQVIKHAKEPVRIKVWTNQKYPRITGFEF